MDNDHFYINSLLKIYEEALEIRKEGGQIIYWDITAFRPFPTYVLDKNIQYPSYVEWLDGKPIKIVVKKEQFSTVTLNNVRV